MVGLSNYQFFVLFDPEFLDTTKPNVQNCLILNLYPIYENVVVGKLNNL